MSSKKPLTRICIRVFESDYNKAQKVAQMRGVPVNVIIRECLHSFILRLNDLERQNLDTIRTEMAKEIPEEITTNETPDDNLEVAHAPT
jgi:hypothetical protein